MSPLRITFPQVIPTLNSERLVLKPITDADADAYFSICSNPVVMRPWGTKCHESMDETRDLIQYLEQEFKHHRMIRWGVFEGGGSTLIGDVGFWRFVFPRARAEIGAKLDPHVWNRGYMTEAMITVLDFGFRGMNLNSIEGNVDPENKGSIRMVEKLGFEQEGYLREHSYCFFRERFVDTLLYSLRASQWKVQWT